MLYDYVVKSHMIESHRIEYNMLYFDWALKPCLVSNTLSPTFSQLRERYEQRVEVESYLSCMYIVPSYLHMPHNNIRNQVLYYWWNNSIIDYITLPLKRVSAHVTVIILRKRIRHNIIWVLYLVSTTFVLASCSIFN